MSPKFCRRFEFLIGAALSVVVAATAFGQEFYRGKTIVFVVGTAPGGGFDTYSRIAARHIGKHIPGNPSTIVQNMPGAGNLIAANYIYNKAAPDGLTVGHFSGSMIFKHVLGDQGVMFDGRKFGWLGTPAPERHACVLTEKTGIKNLDEWSASKRPVKIGSLGPGNATSALPQLLRAVLGLPISVIEGFKGTSDMRLAAEAGEIDGACWGWDSIKVTWAKAVESGFVRPIIQTTLEPHSRSTQCSGCSSTGKNKRRTRFAAIWVSSLWPLGNRLLDASGSTKGPNGDSTERVYGNYEGSRFFGGDEEVEFDSQSDRWSRYH